MTDAAPVPARFETTYRVRFDEAGADGLVRSSALLRYVQDIAWQHSEGAGFGRDWYGERQLTWLVRSLQLDIAGAAPFGSSLTVSTEVVGFRRVWARRLSEITGENGRDVASVLIDWVLLGPGAAPTRVPVEIERAFAVQIPTFAPFRVNADDPGEAAFRQRLTVARRDLDPLAHVNNAVYVEYMEEAVEAAGGAEALASLPRSYRLEYLLPAEANAALTGAVSRSQGGWAYRLFDETGRDVFRGSLSSPTPDG